jgi:hypothetical protein
MWWWRRRTTIKYDDGWEDCQLSGVNASATTGEGIWLELVFFLLVVVIVIIVGGKSAAAVAAAMQ